MLESELERSVEDKRDWFVTGQGKAMWRASGAAMKEICKGKLSNQRVFSGM